MTEHGPLGLEDLMEYALQAGKREAARHDIQEPSLYTVGPKGWKLHRLRRMRSGTQIAVTTKLIVHDEQPDLAVLVTEGWATDLSPEDRRLPDLLTARVQVRQLPESQRWDELWVLGETKRGEEAYWRTRIDPATGKRKQRTFRHTSRVAPSEHIIFTSVFRPLYVQPADLNALLRAALRYVSTEAAVETVSFQPTDTHQH